MNPDPDLAWRITLLQEIKILNEAVQDLQARVSHLEERLHDVEQVVPDVRA